VTMQTVVKEFGFHSATFILNLQRLCLLAAHNLFPPL
jgi:hypothetical protein